ncbi:DUF1697 domain-containing protein [Actinokineospora sp. UTMC 2448]|uniref:DUF1697 domain-containing protein n=1 Tax=Actinokineospora sp. UTMC 2448 TaxID=2268449 RepID=UPI0021646A46|nr:DUF1697 domain-containing protein [Actinokineospora sp. UTMC 2448]UVS76385.1 hypothetical protein Actkin_00069 [Actinokineospora sp. UTMC 2448]
MTGYVLLLRGVNVGGRTKLAMAELRAVLEDLGFGDVRTVLQSGNAVFTADTEPDEREIQAALAERTGLDTRCLVVTAPRLRAVVDGHPFRDVADDGSRMVAIFLEADPDPAVAAAHDPVALDPERIRVGDRVVYQWCPDGISKAPPVVPFLDRRWKVVGTARNWNTVTKLHDLVQRPTA